MITLKRLNVVRKVATEEQAEKLLKQNFERVGGEAETQGKAVSEERLAQVTGALLNKINKKMRDAVSKASAPPDDGKEEKQDGTGSNPPDSGDGTKQPEAAG